MTNAIITQEATEVLEKVTGINATVTQIAVEVLYNQTTAARITQFAVEVLRAELILPVPTVPVMKCAKPLRIQ